MKIMVLGSSGNIGNYLSNYLKKQHQVIALDKDNLDITDKDLVLQQVQSYSPDVVIQAAGLSDIDFCENHETESYTVNTLGTLNVAYACNSLSIPIVYISSAYVYGGEKHSPYFETDKCTPINIYGKSKLAAEKLIRTICSKYFIIRTSWCFGGNDCYIKKALSQSNTPIFLISNAVINPTYIEDLCSSVSQIIASDFYGVYNCVNEGAVSKVDVIKYVFEYFNLQKNVLPLATEAITNIAPRPSYTAMNTCLLYNCFNIKMPSWQDSVKNYLGTISIK
ncbi:SDR family oxidoreductase [Clostridium manihotivorum]|uniref:dTDP-4-dehydrorhamnose reductase n=1 Tax=Clostridium manihotivorum TaxID=2320868 RepID=A0A410DYA1_9CLOT|nr:NAD(P)-dependent oxidoreductase [Clostridium manihotivorum]QAA34047.1 NAD(P)-dependent oxidoreductase [Clostridium manihotivorum]